MKTLKLVVILIVIFLLFFSGCIVNILSPDSTLVCPSDPVSLPGKIISGLVGLYELAVRIIPTVKNYSVISFVFRILLAVSDTLNIKKG